MINGLEEKCKVFECIIIGTLSLQSTYYSNIFWSNFQQHWMYVGFNQG